MANKYSKGKSFLGDHTNIYDDNGQKVGEQRESFWGDHTNIYDKNGNKIGEKRESFWDGHTNYYDANGKKIGEKRESFFGDHENIYNAEGKKIGRSYDPLFGSGREYHVNEPMINSNKNNSGQYGQRGYNSSYDPVYTNRTGYDNAPLDDPTQTLPDTSLFVTGRNRKTNQSGRLTPNEIESYAKRCAGLLKRRLVKTTETTFDFEWYVETKRSGFLGMDKKEKQKMRRVQGDKGWVLDKDERKFKHGGWLLIHRFTTLLTVKGELFEEEYKADISLNRSGDYRTHTHHWKKIEPKRLKSVVPLLDKFLSQHHISMTSEQYWRELHPNGVATRPQSNSQPAARTGSYSKSGNKSAPSNSPNRNKSAGTVQRSGTSKPTGTIKTSRTSQTAGTSRSKSAQVQTTSLTAGSNQKSTPRNQSRTPNSSTEKKPAR